MGRTAWQRTTCQRGDKIGKTLVWPDGVECGAGNGRICRSSVYLAAPSRLVERVAARNGNHKSCSMAHRHDLLSTLAHRHLSETASLWNVDLRDASHSGKRGRK